MQIGSINMSVTMAFQQGAMIFPLTYAAARLIVKNAGDGRVLTSG